MAQFLKILSLVLYAFLVSLNLFSVDITKPCFLRSDSVHNSSKSVNNQTSKERQHKFVMMSFDVLVPTKLKGWDIIFFIFFQSAL